MTLSGGGGFLGGVFPGGSGGGGFLVVPALVCGALVYNGGGILVCVTALGSRVEMT